MTKHIALFIAFLMALGQSAYAALPTGVDTAISGVSTDGVTLVGLIAVAGAAVYLIARVLSRFGFKL